MANAAAVEAYLAALPPEQRAALEHLRATIQAAAPGATETLSYQIPTFRAHGRGLVAYAAFKDHCSLFPMSLSVFERFGAELEPYRSGRSTLRFRPDHPIPLALVKKLVKSRLAENAARASHRTPR